MNHAQTELKWVNEKPARPGWYWYRSASGDGRGWSDLPVQIVLIGQPDVSLPRNAVIVGSELAFSLANAHGQFAGPLPEPAQGLAEGVIHGASVFPDPLWLPIATAPKDGTEILVLFDSATVDVVRLCWWDDGAPRESDNVPGPRPDDVGWWSYKHSVTQEQIEGMTPVGWLPMPKQTAT
jgi:hypothetical protein